MKCPNCHSEVVGKFCARCGTPSQILRCSFCGAAHDGSKHCSNCGAEVGAHVKQAQSRWQIGWAVAGALAVILLVVIAYFTLLQPTNPTVAAQATPEPIGPAPWVDLSTLTAREAADRLFDRVMRAAEVSDVTEMRNFIPMAIAAYELVDSLDSDGAFHLSTLQRVGGDPAAALATARARLDREPTHLLILFEAASATLALGDSAAARAYARQILGLFEILGTDEDPRYEHHQDLLPVLRMRAEEMSFGF